MSIYDSKIWIEDLDEAIASIPEIEELTGSSVMITGAAGLICSAVTDLLIRWNETHSEKIRIVTAGRSREKMRERFAPFFDEKWFSFITYDASSSNNDLPIAVDYIIHGASNASPNKIIKEPVETMLSNFNGMKELLDYARENTVKRLLYISSSEVYGRKETDLPSKINDYGGIDILNPRSSYSIGKCAAETLCSAYSSEYNVDSVIVRPGHIYGPTASESDNRVSSAWAYAVAKGGGIIMKSNGAQIRSYCYCLDCATAILTVLLNGESAKAYNISNPDSILSIREMAEILAGTAGVELKMELPTESEKKGFNPMSNSSLDSTELLSLGWRGLFDAERGFSHTVKVIKDKA